MKLTKPEFEALGKLMEWEIASAFEPNPLPVALNAAIAKSLYDKGLVQYCTATLPGRFPVTIKYHAFTAAGHMAFCYGCAEVAEEEDEPCLQVSE